jgi:hypothetical protein
VRERQYADAGDRVHLEVRGLVLHEIEQRADMDKTNTPTQQGGVWSWVVIGLVFCVVTAALYGPFIWELTHSV